MTRFGDQVRRVREELLQADPQYSLRKVAGRVGVEPAYLPKIERGVFPPPSEEVIVKLAAELRLKSDVFLAMAGKLASDIQDVILKRPELFADLLRDLRPMPDHAVLRVVREVKDGRW